MGNHECVDVATDIESGSIFLGINVKERHLTNLCRERQVFVVWSEHG